MAGWIVVVRRPGFGVWEARFALLIDGRRVAKLKREAMRDFEVEAGVHRVRVRQLGYLSKTLEVSVADGETVVVRTRTRGWAGFLNGMFGSLIGGNAVWLCAQRETAVTMAGFGIGVVGTVALLWSGVVFSLRTDPVAP